MRSIVLRRLLALLLLLPATGCVTTAPLQTPEVLDPGQVTTYVGFTTPRRIVVNSPSGPTEYNPPVGSGLTGGVQFGVFPRTSLGVDLNPVAGYGLHAKVHVLSLNVGGHEVWVTGIGGSGWGAYTESGLWGGVDVEHRSRARHAGVLVGTDQFYVGGQWFDLRYEYDREDRSAIDVRQSGPRLTLGAAGHFQRQGAARAVVEVHTYFLPDPLPVFSAGLQFKLFE